MFLSSLKQKSEPFKNISTYYKNSYYFAVRVDLCVILGDVFLETGSATSATTSHVTTSGEQDGGRDELICNLSVCFRKIMVFLSF